ncbi:DUF2149 domain-containing protein [Thalassotalea profundi]|nr:DUF2149 domain-containing protein [Thalassotalea profundi]
MHTKEEGKIVRYKAESSDNVSQVKGKKVGSAYQLGNGEIIYIPDGDL